MLPDTGSRDAKGASSGRRRREIVRPSGAVRTRGQRGRSDPPFDRTQGRQHDGSGERTGRSFQLSRQKAPKKRPDNGYPNTTDDYRYQFISHIGFSDLLSDGDTACRGRYRAATKINASACVKHSLRHAFAALCWRLSAD